MGYILIIEDEPAIVMVLEEMLKDEGFKTRKAYDGLTGFNMLHKLPKPDLVLIDLNMPGIKGKEIIESMRAEDRLKDVPVIIITGTVYNSTDFPPEGSYQSIFEKPFELSPLLDKIKELINKASTA